MRIDLEHQFVLPLLAILAYPVEASRSEMSAPFSKIIKFAMEKLLGSDVHEIAFARLIEAFDYQRAGAFQFQERRTTVKRELRLHRRGAFNGVAKNSARELARLVARQRQIAGIARHLGAGNSSPLHVALVGPDLHCPSANRLAHAGVQVAQHDAAASTQFDGLSRFDIERRSGTSGCDDHGDLSAN